MKAKQPVSPIDLIALSTCIMLDIGLLSYTASRVWSYAGPQLGRAVWFMLWNLIAGSLFVFSGLRSLNATLRPVSCDSDEMEEKYLRVSPKYSTVMLTYGAVLLLVTLAGSLVCVNLLLNRLLKV